MSVVSPHTISATLVMLVFMYTSMFSTGLSFSPFSLCIFIFRHPNSVYFLNEIFYFYPEKAEEWKKLFCVCVLEGKRTCFSLTSSCSAKKR